MTTPSPSPIAIAPAPAPAAFALPDDYICPDPEPKDMQQLPTLAKSAYFVARHFAGQPDTLVSGDIPVNYDPANMNVRVEADLCVAYGVNVAAIKRRNGYIIWEVGKPPDFLLEVASTSTHQRDTGFKRRLYADLGVAEYWRVDPSGGNHYGRPLAGDRLVDGVYADIPLTHEADGMIWGYSAVLDLYLCWHPEWGWDFDDETNLRFYSRQTERYLCDMTLVERRLGVAQASLIVAEDRLDIERRAWAQERAATQTELEREQRARAQEQQARAAAEARIRELEERLRRQQS